MCFDDPIKKCANLTANLITSAYKSEVIKFKSDENPLQRREYLLSFMNSLRIGLSQFTETYMLLMNYPPIRREELPYYSK